MVIQLFGWHDTIWFINTLFQIIFSTLYTVFRWKGQSWNSRLGMMYLCNILEKIKKSYCTIGLTPPIQKTGLITKYTLKTCAGLTDIWNGSYASQLSLIHI